MATSRNTAWVFAGQLAEKVASLGFFIVVARVLGVREYGYFTFAVSLVPLVLSFGKLGLDLTLVRELARAPERTADLLATALAARVCTGLLGLGLAVAVGSVLVDSGQALATLLVVGLALVADDCTSLFTSTFNAHERMRLSAITGVLNRAASTVLALVVLTVGGDLLAVVLAYLVGSVAALVYAYAALARTIHLLRPSDVDRTLGRSLVWNGRKFGAAGLVNLALFRADGVLLQAIRGSVAVGLYGAAYRFFESLLFITQGLMSLTAPRIAKDGPGAKSTRTLDTAVAIALAFYLPIAAGAPFAANALVASLFGDRYADAARAVPWLTAAAVFYCIAFMCRVAVIALGRRDGVLTVGIVSLTVNLALNAVLIPTRGFVGAAIATLVTEILEAALTLRLLARAGIDPRSTRLVIVPVIATGIMLGALVVLDLTGLAAVIVGAAVYLVASALALTTVGAERRRDVRAMITG